MLKRTAYASKTSALQQSMWYNVPHGPVPHFCQDHTKRVYSAMSQRNTMKEPSNEAKIQLLLQDMRQDASLALWRAAATYRVVEKTLRR